MENFDFLIFKTWDWEFQGFRAVVEKDLFQLVTTSLTLAYEQARQQPAPAPKPAVSNVEKNEPASKSTTPPIFGLHLGQAPSFPRCENASGVGTKTPCIYDSVDMDPYKNEPQILHEFYFPLEQRTGTFFNHPIRLITIGGKVEVVIITVNDPTTAVKELRLKYGKPKKFVERPLEAYWEFPEYTVGYNSLNTNIRVKSRKYIRSEEEKELETQKNKPKF